MENKMDKYTDLSEREQREFITKLIHAMQEDSGLFNRAKAIVQAAEIYGIFDNTKFGIEETTKTNER